MKLHRADVELSEQEITSFINNYFSDTEPIADLRVECSDDGVIVAGKIKKLVWIAFQAFLLLRGSGSTIEIEVSRIDARVPLLNKLRRFLFSLIEMLLPEVAGVSRSGDTFQFDIEQILSESDIGAEINIKKFSAGDGFLRLQLSGDIDTSIWS